MKMSRKQFIYDVPFSELAADALYDYLSEVDPDADFQPYVLRRIVKEFTSVDEYNELFGTTYKTVYDIMRDNFIIMVDDEQHFLVLWR